MQGPICYKLRGSPRCWALKCSMVGAGQCFSVWLVDGCEKNNQTTNPTKGKLTAPAQVRNPISGHLVSKLARETGVDAMNRTFSAWSHVVALLYAQLTHAIGPNDVCDDQRCH
ncbi:MAG: DUF4372 domain-containing protein [Puniceicoccaceae bacterium]|nr:MAG: DUF4372 domain-containing protein [Puniceicoccaceae bacterium]